MRSGLRAPEAGAKVLRILWQVGLRASFVALGTCVLRTLGFEFAFLEALAAAACASIVVASVATTAERSNPGKPRDRRV
jgi:hypothetical protein